MNIYIRNLPLDVIEEDLHHFFTEYGAVSSAKIVRDKVTGSSRGFGFVEMPDEEAAKKAIKELDRGKIDEQEITVMEAKRRRKESSDLFRRRESNHFACTSLSFRSSLYNQ